MSDVITIHTGMAPCTCYVGGTWSMTFFVPDPACPLSRPADADGA